MITFDKGEMWHYLSPPTHDSNGSRITYSDEANLHLHGYSDPRFSPFYSTKNSNGIIMGTGNIGKYLSTEPEDINTYMSRDGGKSWIEIAKGSHIYEISDRGLVLVMASN